ncbi:acetoacetate--CoA ligase [Piscinibacter sakaiensis]|uniref:Acetoacetyl-CoA synthetase n=1 Tax=Piscinibacter sakaiensis TaxID=1547922 RepID=A0A0K8NYI0_PISS1|nr:acetoacetate--CoA ligase [Piscinibacter sakaiensis]GAP35428.1 acetoacetyl-CoA synthetase [Piscinibacter sakaiensis]
MTLPRPRILDYTDWLARERGRHFDVGTPEGYDALWRWSVDDLEGFWRSVWDYFDLGSPTAFERVLAEPVMPGARWFEGARLNYAGQVFRHADRAHAAGHPAIVHQDERLRERGEMGELSWPELRRRVASLAARLRAMGVRPGDRVCAFLPNTPAAAIGLLAAASVGAVWSICSPDMGPVAVLDRFRQIEPTVLLACDGYVYGGIAHDRRPVLAELVAALPTLRHLVLWRHLDAQADAAALAGPARTLHDFADCTGDDVPLEIASLPFDHPLWIVYSSGTTGLPKPIVHGHGGIVVEGLKGNVLHNDLGPSAETGDRFHWYSATGWIMWNSQIAGLLCGTTIAIYDGSPSGRHGSADWGTLWRFAAEAGVTFFGAGAAFYASCLKAGVEPQAQADLSRLRAVGSTGSPLAAECYRWLWQQLPRPGGREIWIATISGGTDFAGAFVAGLRTLPVLEGEMQVRCLGAAVEAWDEAGRHHVDQVGELVCVRPMPSMPLYFWNDPGGERYRSSYFDTYPGVWRHGDWIRITPRGGAIIYGRSDATINRHGIRMGTAELYRAVEAEPAVLDSLVVDLEYLGRESYMPLFVVLREGQVLDEALTQRLKAAIRDALSARHVPNEILQVPAIPRTLSGKKMELPVKKLLLGTPPEQVFKLDAMANADAVAWFVDFARRRS